MASNKYKRIKQVKISGGVYTYEAYIQLHIDTGTFEITFQVKDREGDDAKVTLADKTLSGLDAKIAEWGAAVDGIEWRSAVVYLFEKKRYSEVISGEIDRAVILLDPTMKFEKTKANYVVPFREQTAHTLIFFEDTEAEAIKTVDAMLAVLEEARAAKEEMQARIKDMSKASMDLALQLDAVAEIQGVSSLTSDDVLAKLQGIIVDRKALPSPVIEA